MARQRTGTLSCMSSLMPRLDRFTRAFWRVTGRPVDLAGAEHWLSAPMHNGQTIGDGWLQAAAATHHGSVREDVAGGGLVADLAQLDGPGFKAAELRPEIRDFYEHTSDWRMEVWTGWQAVFQPGGELVSRLFGRRVHLFLFVKVREGWTDDRERYDAMRLDYQE